MWSFLVLLSCLASVTLACAPAKGATITIGGDTYVCIVVNFKSYMVAVPKADDYSRIAVSGSFNDVVKFGPGYARSTCPNSATNGTNFFNYGKDASAGLCQYTTVHVESHGVKSLTKAYKIFQKSNEPAVTPNYVFPVMTAVIQVAKGIVETITWDDGCHFCDSLSNSADGVNQQCVPNVFAQPNATQITGDDTASSLTFPYTLEQLTGAKVDGHGQSCVTYSAPSIQKNTNGEDCLKNGGADCDLKVYVVWTGTDADGAYFQSAGLRFSRFQQFAISSLYVSARALSLEVYEGAKDTATDAANTVASRL
jgi:hypothetical protein